jgi:hypothetical protein
MGEKKEEETTSVSKADILKPAENIRKDGRPVHYIIKNRIIIFSSLHCFVGKDLDWGFLNWQVCLCFYKSAKSVFQTNKKKSN